MFIREFANPTKHSEYHVRSVISEKKSSKKSASNAELKMLQLWVWGNRGSVGWVKAVI